MKAKVVSEFHDVNKYSKIYSVGDVVDFDDARVESLVSRGLATPLAEAPKEEVKVKKTEAPKVETPKEDTPKDVKPKAKAKAEKEA